MAHWPIEGKKDGKWIRFLHIPRTGGRYVQAAFSSTYSSNTIENPSENFFGTCGSWITNGRDTVHLSLEDVRKAVRGIQFIYPNFEYERMFTVIRNPVDRFRSASRQLRNLMTSVPFKVDSYEAFVVLMESWPFLGEYDISNHRPPEEFYVSRHPAFYVGYTGLRNEVNNWWTDQRDYIDENVLVWRYEDGLDGDFHEWIQENVVTDGRTVDWNVEYYRDHYDYLKTTEEVFFRQLRPFVEQYLEEECKALGY